MRHIREITPAYANTKDYFYGLLRGLTSDENVSSRRYVAPNPLGGPDANFNKNKDGNR